MKFFLSSRERTAGLFLVGAALLVAAFVIGAAVRNRWFSPRVSYHSLLKRGDGLRAGSPILLSGVEVGHVGGITIRDDDQVDVELVVLAENANHIRIGMQVVPRRLLGIGEKRLHLVPKPGATELISAGANIPANEPTELLDLVENLNLGDTMQSLDKILTSLDRNLSRLDQNERMDKLFSALDHVQPMVEHLDSLVTNAERPLVAILKDPNLPGAVRGLAKVTNDPSVPPLIRNATAALDNERLDKVLGRAVSMIDRIDRLTADDSHLGRLLANGDKLLGDGRADRLAASLEKLTDEKKLGALVDHLGTLTDQMAKVGPEIPTLTKDLDVTLKEAVVVLKALQQTWILDRQSKQVREEMAR